MADTRPVSYTHLDVYKRQFWSNSEVGAARFRATLFLYESVCGNHICWNTKTIGEVTIRHTGEARRAFSEAMASITARMETAASDDEIRIRQAKQKLLGQSKEEVVDFVYGKSFGLSRKDCEEAYVLADRHADLHGNEPNSAWGFASGVTRLSQQNYADKRDAMDRAAGKVLQLAF